MYFIMLFISINFMLNFYIDYTMSLDFPGSYRHLNNINSFIYKHGLSFCWFLHCSDFSCESLDTCVHKLEYLVKPGN